MSFIKVLSTNNFQNQFIVTNEDAGSFSCIDKHGDYHQIQKGKDEIDSVKEYREDEFYLYEKCSKLKSVVLRQRTEAVRNDLAKYLHLNLAPGSQNQTFLDESKNTTIQFHYALYDVANEVCEIDIYESQLKFGQDQLREIVVLVLEEFGTFYLDGQKLRDYFSGIKPQKKKGKNYWTLVVDYNNLIGVKGYKGFQYYSEDMNYTQNFTNKEQNNNIVDFGVIKKVHDLQRDLSRRSKGFTLKKSA